jgi:type II secretory pathway component GspD/PulD (secretin)
METRIYHLRKGVMLPEADSIQATESMPSVSTGSRLGTPRTRSFGGGTTGAAAAGGGAQGDTKLEQVIDTFVPKPEGSNFFFHRDAHVLIARNTRENLRLVEQIIEALDITPQQVLIEARFIEVGVDDLRELGIEWALNSDYAVTRRAGGRSETIIKSGSGVTFPTPATTPGGFNLTYTGVLTDPMFQAVLHALHTSGKSKTLAVPRVTTVNNIAAKIRVGQDFRYFEQFERQSVLSSVTGVGGTPVYTSELVPVGTPTLEELGIQLNVLPSVGADSEEITLVLAPQNKDFVRFEEFTFGPTVGGTLTNGNSLSGGTIRLPIFNVSEITTRVIVRSGETVVMGGLVRTSTQRQTNKFPILGDIPVLGALFRRTSNDETRSNLLIFVTATLIGYSGESLVPVR